MEQIRTKAHTVSCDENGIIHVAIMENAHVDKDAIIALHKVYLQLGCNEKKLVKFDARAHHTMCNTALEYLKTDMLDDSLIATAVVSEKIGIRLMVDYFTNIVKTKSAMKMFPTETEAIQWLQGF